MVIEMNVDMMINDALTTRDTRPHRLMRGRYIYR